jgi:hypothetical protein
MTDVHADPWDAVISSGKLSLTSFITLSCVNRSLRRLCEHRAVRTAAQDLLLQAVSAAALPAELEADDAEPHDFVACFEQQMAWLMKRVPHLLQDSSIMSAITQVHQVPRIVAVALLRSGAQVTWQQLLDAANSLVPGLQVWADASRMLEVPLHESVPSAAAAICCGDELDFEVRFVTSSVCT